MVSNLKELIYIRTYSWNEMHRSMTDRRIGTVALLGCLTPGGARLDVVILYSLGKICDSFLLLSYCFHGHPESTCSVYKPMHLE